MSSMDQFARPHYAPSQDLRNLEPALEGAGVWLVIPCYKVTDHIMRVIDRAPAWVEGIVCVDDACPDRSGDLIEARCADPRVQVLRLAQNQGVGGATLASVARPYTVDCWLWLKAMFAELSEEERESLRPILEPAGFWGALDFAPGEAQRLKPFAKL